MRPPIPEYGAAPVTLTLIRVGQSSLGTFGVLRYKDVPFAITLEQPWADNALGASCIPAGTYQCRRVQSPKFGNTFEVMDVPGRTHILFHKGNTVEDTHGCILIAEEFAWVLDKPSVVSSQRGFDEFMSLMGKQHEFCLEIA